MRKKWLKPALKLKKILLTLSARTIIKKSIFYKTAPNFEKTIHQKANSSLSDIRSNDLDQQKGYTIAAYF